jgi:hypothetical protein
MFFLIHLLISSYCDLDLNLVPPNGSSNRWYLFRNFRSNWVNCLCCCSVSGSGSDSSKASNTTVPVFLVTMHSHLTEPISQHDNRYP